MKKIILLVFMILVVSCTPTDNNSANNSSVGGVFLLKGVTTFPDKKTETVIYTYQPDSLVARSETTYSYNNIENSTKFTYLKKRLIKTEKFTNDLPVLYNNYVYYSDASSLQGKVNYIETNGAVKKIFFLYNGDKWGKPLYGLEYLKDNGDTITTYNDYPLYGADGREDNYQGYSSNGFGGSAPIGFTMLDGNGTKVYNKLFFSYDYLFLNGLVHVGRQIENVIFSTTTNGVDKITTYVNTYDYSDDNHLKSINIICSISGVISYTQVFTFGGLK